MSGGLRSQDRVGVSLVHSFSDRCSNVNANGVEPGTFAVSPWAICVVA